jgi:hypothetical protein
MNAILTYPILLCLTSGLAPFRPQPHIVEKLCMLFSDALSRPIDVFDLLLHSAPFALLAVKIVLDVRGG